MEQIHEILTYLSIWGYIIEDNGDISLSTIMYIISTGYSDIGITGKGEMRLTKEIITD